MTVTPDQFAALSELLRLRAGPAEQAAFFVLVEGRAVADAARDAGLEYRAAYQAVQRALRGLELARTAAGFPPKPAASRNLDAMVGARVAMWEKEQKAENERASRLLDKLIHKPTSGS